MTNEDPRPIDDFSTARIERDKADMPEVEEPAAEDADTSSDEDLGEHPEDREV